MTVSPIPHSMRVVADLIARGLPAFLVTVHERGSVSVSCRKGRDVAAWADEFGTAVSVRRVDCDEPFMAHNTSANYLGIWISIAFYDHDPAAVAAEQVTS